MNSDFEAKHIKKSVRALDKHIRSAESYAKINKKYKKDIFKEPSKWKRLLGFFKS